MTERDRFDEQTSRQAHEWLAWRSTTIDIDAEFAALEDLLAGRSSLRRPLGRRSVTTRSVSIAASVLIIATGIAAIGWTQRHRDTEAPATPVDSIMPDITVDPSLSVTSTPLVAVTTIPIAQACTGQPQPPPTLSDGSTVGSPDIQPTADGRVARWGDADAPNVIYQPLDVTIDPSFLDEAMADGRAIAAGPYETVAIPVSDPPLGQITIYLRDNGVGCLRAYIVGPGLLQADADALANQWIESLATVIETVEIGEQQAVTGTITTLPMPDGTPDVLTVFIDDEHRRCVQARDPDGYGPAVCFDDQVDDLSFVAPPADDTGAVYAFGGTELDDATQIVAVVPGAGEIVIPLMDIDGWPERVFAARLDELPTDVRVEDANGHVLASGWYPPHPD